MWISHVRPAPIRAACARASESDWCVQCGSMRRAFITRQSKCCKQAYEVSGMESMSVIHAIGPIRYPMIGKGPCITRKGTTSTELPCMLLTVKGTPSAIFSSGMFCSPARG